VAFRYPPAVTIDNFRGGYKSVSNYTDLGDTETNNAANVIYSPGGDLYQRDGSLRLYNTGLTGSGTSVRPITGHFYFDKLGASGTAHVVAAGGVLYNYNSSTATQILSGLTDDSEAFWQFHQIQDPRSGSDDIVVGTNGNDSMTLWNGSGTAVYLSSLTSATQVPIAKYLLNHKNRLYAFNVVDDTDADAAVKVKISSFGGDGAPDPHRFTETFYCGGASSDGDIRGARVINDQIAIYTRNSVWKLTPGAGTALDTASLQQLESSLGLFAPFSLVDTGDFHIFLSERGVYAFDGNGFAHLSRDVDSDLLDNSNRSRLSLAKGVFNKRMNQYTLYYAHGSSTRNNRALVYDLKIKAWQPPVTGRQVSYASEFRDSNGTERLIYGDYFGQLFEDNASVKNDGFVTGYNGTIESATGSTITDSDADFLTTGDGLMGAMVRITGGPGDGEEYVIESNTSAVLTLETAPTTTFTTATTYSVAAIDGYWQSKDFDFGARDIVKLFRNLRIRTREEGNFNLNVCYIVDFKKLAEATCKALSLFGGGFTWGLSVWGGAKWGRKKAITGKISMRPTTTQSLNGTHLALRFSNNQANQSFKITGFDAELKRRSKR